MLICMYFGGCHPVKKQKYTQKQMFVITFCKTIPLTYREIDTRLKATPTHQDLSFPHIWHNQFWFLYVNDVVFEYLWCLEPLLSSFF